MIANLLNLSKRASLNLPISNCVNNLCPKISSLRLREWPDLQLNNNRFIVFDTETTGLDCKNDEIIAWAGVVIEQDQITDSTFSSLVNPGRNIPTLATEITGITNDMVAAAPDVLTVLDRFFEFSGLSMLVAHNSHFDFGFINAKLQKYCRQKLRPPVLDTYLISYLLFPNRKSRTLDSLAQTYGISLSGRHTALGDSLITARLFLAMVEDLKALGVTTTGHLMNSLKFRHLL